MLSDAAKAKVLAALQPLYADPDFANMDGDFIVNVSTVPIAPSPDSEQVDVVKP